MESLPNLTIERQDSVVLVTFERPTALNAMNSALMAELTAIFAALDSDAGVGAIILTGRGKAFMAGADIKEYAAFTPAEFAAFQHNGRRMYDGIERCSKPVIAAVNGYALGGGFEMVLACDLVVARSDARMGLPEIKLALVPGGGGTQRLTQRIGPNRAFEMLALGSQVSGATLHDWGLVNRIADDDVVAAAMTLAKEIAAESATSVRELKRLVRLARESALSAGLDAEIAALERLYASAEGQSRIAEFADRAERRARQ